MMKDFWDQRYSDEAYAYGESPNEFLAEELLRLSPKSILFAAEGEGRNAVFAAKLGWQTTAFDISQQGQIKAMSLALKNDVSINYHVGLLEDMTFENEKFDSIALIYAHFPAEIKSLIHGRLNNLLKPGGVIIFEAFSKNNLSYVEKNPQIGGPRDVDSLFSIEELKSDFKNYEVLRLSEEEVELHEGKYHNGKGMVVRFVGKKL